METNFDKIFKTIESLENSHIIYLHCEAKGYVYKTFNGEWKRSGFEFINYIAGLGDKKNYSLF